MKTQRVILHRETQDISTKQGGEGSVAESARQKQKHLQQFHAQDTPLVPEGKGGATRGELDPSKTIKDFFLH